METTESLPFIDVTLDAASSCNNSRINNCCRQAFENGVKKLGTETVAAALLSVRCLGPNESGCQAVISGHLVDKEGVPVAEVNSSVQELAELADQ